MRLIQEKPSIFFIEKNEVAFPPYNIWGDDDLVAVGGNLSPDMLVLAYQNGLFPWFVKDGYPYWFSPLKRLILKPNDFKVSKSLKKSIRNRGFEIVFDQNFKTIMRSCRNIKRKDENESWITEEYIENYNKLFLNGIGHSVEVYLDNKLVGGLYGLALNKVFFGESMFSEVSDASKIALFALCNELKDKDFKIIDCQVPSEHLKSLGAIEISRDHYLSILNFKVS